MTISLERVSKTYPSDTGPIHALEDITLTVKEGEFLAIIGPSGCGKTTVLKIIGGLLEPTSGDISVFGEAPHNARVKRTFGFVFQSAALLPWRTVEQNLLLPLEITGNATEARQKIPTLLEKVGLKGFGLKYPWELSGGMKQRVAFARALSHNPRVLLMDEPFGALDAFTRSSLQDLLLGVWSSDARTILFVTHDVTEAVFLADRIAVLSERPARVQKIVPVHLARPRTAEVRFGQEFSLLVQEVLRLIHSNKL